jgi:hypothetical protein
VRINRVIQPDFGAGSSYSNDWLENLQLPEGPVVCAWWIFVGSKNQSLVRLAV